MQRIISNPEWRSFLPEKTLIGQRDADALKAKYLARQPRGNLLRLLHAYEYGSADDTLHFNNDISVLENFKTLGSLVVQVKHDLPVGGFDGIYSLQEGDRQTIQLHLKGDGLKTARRDICMAADYIAAHQQLREKELVTGVTYSELGRLMGRFGFRQMQLDGELEFDFHQHLKATHQVFCALNGIQNRPLEPVLMYLPTTEFIERFGSQS